MNNQHDEISNIVPPQKSRRGRKRVTDPVLVKELKRHRRSRANDRERTRMRLLNEALEHLRTLLPMDSTTCYSSTESSSSTGPMLEDKLTKIETLRTASAYIRLLTDLLEENSSQSTNTMNPYDYSSTHGSLYSNSSYLTYPPSYSSFYHPYY